MNEIRGKMPSKVKQVIGLNIKNMQIYVTADRKLMRILFHICKNTKIYI